MTSAHNGGGANKLKNIIMNSYIGVKSVLAKPMNRLEYNKYRGWELPSDENGEDGGFLVEYIDGGQSNHPDHKGYISWSPIDVFGKSYSKLSTYFITGIELLPHQERVVNELKELEVKVEALKTFIDTEFFELNINLDEQLRMKNQLMAMTCYLSILYDRVNNF